MTTASRPLLFQDVDGLAFAALRGRLGRAVAVPTYEPAQLGPLFELLHLFTGGRIPSPRDWLSPNGATPLVTALEEKKASWSNPLDPYMGFIRAASEETDRASRWTSFLMRAKRAAMDISGLPATVSGQLVAAMEELENNVHEHSRAPETGVIAYRAETGAFEFVVADHGIGILRSLCSCPDFTLLRDEGTALQAALTDGVSRYGTDCQRGHGFRPIFTGLVNLHGELRFRSGDHAVIMDGTKPEVTTARTAQKAPIDGFLASVRCHFSTS